MTATKEGTFLSGGTLAISQTSSAFDILVPVPSNFGITGAAAKGSSATLAWANSANAASYTVKYGTVSGVFGTTASTSATSPLTITGLTPNTTYYFMVTATNASGSTDATSEASATPLAAFDITNVTVTAANSMSVSWPAVSGATSYTVKYGTTSGAYGITASTTASSPLLISGLTSGQTYYVMVSAVNAGGSVNANSEGSATTIASFLTSTFTPSLLGGSVAWSSVAGATSYDVLYDTTSKTAAQSYASAALGVASPAAISALAAGTTYYFRVRANNANGSVVSTNEISGVPRQSFTLDIPFTAGTEANYLFNDLTYASTMAVDFVGDRARLKPADQTDSSANTTASAGGFKNGTLNGVQWDNTSGYLRLNTTTNNSELDPSWAPKWDKISAYWKLNGSTGPITTGATVPATVGGSSLDFVA
ncbi:MAG: hypothetical protein EOO39_37430, partial [Cytophagaceae bacterium]